MQKVIFALESQLKHSVYFEVGKGYGVIMVTTRV